MLGGWYCTPVLCDTEVQGCVSDSVGGLGIVELSDFSSGPLFQHCLYIVTLRATRYDVPAIHSNKTFHNIVDQEPFLLYYLSTTKDVTCLSVYKATDTGCGKVVGVLTRF